MTSGSADVLCVDLDGAITLVECKLDQNRSGRREVVGQILSYAASLWELDFTELDRRWTNSTGTPLTAAISDLGDQDFVPAEFEASVKANLAAGSFHLVIVVDAVSNELRSIVEYVNAQSQGGFRIVLLELTHVLHEKVQVLMPTVYGVDDGDGRARRGGGSVGWTRATASEAMVEMVDDGKAALDRLLTRGARLGPISTGRGEKPTLSGQAVLQGRKTARWSLTVSDGQLRLKINRKSTRRALGDDLADEIDQRLAQIPALADVFGDFDTWPDNRNPRVAVDDLDPAAVDAIIDVLYEHDDGAYTPAAD